MSSHFLCHPVVEWLGEISASVYLIHHPLIMYVAWISNHGKVLKWPPKGIVCGWLEESIEVKMKCLREQMDFDLSRMTPPSAAAGIVLYGIIAGAMVTYWFERPLQQCLRKSSLSGSGGSNGVDRSPQRKVNVTKEVELVVELEESEGLLSSSDSA